MAIFGSVAQEAVVHDILERIRRRKAMLESQTNPDAYRELTELEFEIREEILHRVLLGWY